MKKINSIIVLSALFLALSPAVVYAQEEEDTTPEPSFSLSGTVDTYFRSSFTEDPVAPGTSFANLNGFALGMANFIVSYEGEKSGFVAEMKHP